MRIMTEERGVTFDGAWVGDWGSVVRTSSRWELPILVAFIVLRSQDDDNDDGDDDDNIDNSSNDSKNNDNDNNNNNNDNDNDDDDNDDDLSSR